MCFFRIWNVSYGYFGPMWLPLICTTRKPWYSSHVADVSFGFEFGYVFRKKNLQNSGLISTDKKNLAEIIIVNKKSVNVSKRLSDTVC